MKKIYISVIVAVIAVVAISYGMIADTTTFVVEPVVVEPATSIFTVSAQDIESAVIPDSIATKNNAFTIDFYRQVSNELDDDSNIFFSPTSIYMAFSILYEGAKQNTAKEIQQVFGFEPDAIMRHNDTAHAISSINRDDPHATLVMANALWLADWFEPYDSYIDIGRQTYLAGIKTVSFTEPEEEPEGVKQINEWASDNTNGKIPKVIGNDDVNHLTAMAITNAIYFKGMWLTQFDPENTKESDFWTSESKNTAANFMVHDATFPYTKSHGAQVLKMPYDGGRLSMLVILPEDRHGIDALEESLTQEMIEGWQQNMHSTDVLVEMPQFKMKTSYDLKKHLQNLGMIDVFSKKASDLSGIANVESENLYVSKATQVAFVDVNEEGTEAAAVTTPLVRYQDSSPPPPRFIADHPFIFIIQDDESGAILFMGRLSDPDS